uniref:Uncharacterized protein n=1 Tax=Aquila chrysaetos chrysaetos TaxID=223781 RepID=A0A663E437_AQUCH
ACSLSQGGRSSPSTGACQEARRRVGPWESPSPPGLRRHPRPSKTGTPKRRAEEDLGLAAVPLPSAGARGSLGFGDTLGGSWSHLLACSLYKYLLRGKDIKSTWEHLCSCWDLMSHHKPFHKHFVSDRKQRAKYLIPSLSWAAPSIFMP